MTDPLPEQILVKSARLLLPQPETEDQLPFERIFFDPAMMHYLGGTWDAGKVAEVIQEWHELWGKDHIRCGVLVKLDTRGGVHGWRERKHPHR